MIAPRRGLVAALVLATPALVGLGYSLLAAVGLTGPGAAGGSLARIAEVLGDPAVWRGLVWSLWVAGASTLLATAGATLVAVAFRGSRPSDRLARALAVLPLPVPHLVAAAGAVLLLGQSGYLARVAMALGVVPGPGDMPPLIYDRFGAGLILTLAWKEFPFLALVASGILATRGTLLEEVARTLGAGARHAFRTITWPILWRGLMPAVVAVFTFAAGTWEATFLLAPSNPRALPLLTLERYTGADLLERGDAFVLVLLGMGVSLAAVAAHEWARARWERLEA